ncbi:MAG: hypothetical protein QW607_05980 [Desulfurococcaceae archaeon]
MKSSVALALIIASLFSMAINLVFNLDRQIADFYSQTYNQLADSCSQAYKWLNENILNPPDFSLNFTGREIIVQGRGFSPNVNLSVYLGNITLNNCSTNESGQFNCSFPVPENISGGEYTFIVDDKMGKNKSKKIFIPTQTPEPTSTISPTIYIIIILILVSIIFSMIFLKRRRRL